MVKFALVLDGTEHFIELDKHVCTQRALDEWGEALYADGEDVPKESRKTGDEKLRAWLGRHAKAMSLTNECGQTATRPEELTREFLNDLHVAVMRFLYGLGTTSYHQAAKLGEAQGGTS